MTDQERAIAAQIEQLMGGTVVAIERQARWRQAWFAEVERDGTSIPLYLRGDKGLDAEVFPGLARERAILQILEQGGLPVPHVYGMIQDPLAIVMDRAPGTRDVSVASPAQRTEIARAYMDIVGQMHALDPVLFAQAGVEPHSDPKRTAMAYLDANLPLYRRTKCSPQPLIEFMLRWIERNIPTTPIEARFIHMDSGQFLIQDGRITAIYDFETSHIGDPHADLATLRLRDGTEPLGADISEMICYYRDRTGFQVDPWMLSFHTLIMSLASAMALAGPMEELKDQDLQLEYLVWDLMSRRGALWALAECMGRTITPEAAIVPSLSGPASRLPRVLEGTIDRLQPQNAHDEVNRAAALTLARWSASLIAVGALDEAAEIAGVEAIVGQRPVDWAEAQALLEQFVLQAGPEHDGTLFNHFVARVEAEVAAATPIHDRLDYYALRRIQL